MPIPSPQLPSQIPSPTQSNRTTLNIHQHTRTIEHRQVRPSLETTISHQQHTLNFLRKAFLPPPQPPPRLAKGRQQRRTAPGPQPLKPIPQTAGSLQTLDLPTRSQPADGKQRQARALPVGVVEQLRQQALGIGQRLMPAGRGRGIDYHQPQFVGRSAAQVEQQRVAAAWPALEQRPRPIHRSAAGVAARPLPTILQAPRPGPGIRPRITARANA